MKYKKIVTLLLTLAFLSFTSLHLPASAQPPTINRPMEIIEATTQGYSPKTVDPAVNYDTAGIELIQNVYDTLVTYDGERTDVYLPALATSWTIENITGTISPQGLPWFYRYTFAIRSGVQFQDASLLTPADVEYSFEREMVMDIVNGPQWMLYEPLLNIWGADGLGNGDFNDPVNIQYVGMLIDQAVESNATHVWFNLAFPGAYSPFMQILCQTWSGILSMTWINNFVIAQEGRPDWSGDWMENGYYTEWVNHRNPTASPLDTPTPIMMGCGPFAFESLDYVLQQASLNRFTDYWRGWPIDFPKTSSPLAQPKGYINHFVVTWAYDWPTSKAMFLAGDIDFVAVPRANIFELYQNPNPPYARPNYPLDGIRCIHPLPTLTCNAMFFTFAIDPTTPYGPIGPPGVFNPSWIPSDFFGNPTWGVNVRKGFAYAFDYDAFVLAAYSGEAMHPATAIIPGLSYHDPSITGYSYNLTAAQEEFQAVPGLWDTGFNITLVFNVGNVARGTACALLSAALTGLNPLFSCNVLAVPWTEYIDNLRLQRLPIFQPGGWLADYPDAHDFAYAFYHSQGYFAALQLYNNPVMDALIDLGIRTPNGPERQAIYTQIQQLVIQDCPSIVRDQQCGRHFERDWIVGWYHNSMYYGNQYVANLWKWYYIPHSLGNTVTQPTSSMLPADCNYDGRVNILDVITPAIRFRALAGPPIDSKWNFRCDFNNDRKIDGRDIAYVARNFGGQSPVWTPTP